MRIRLRPKLDKHGKRYLFAGIEALNAVVFVHELASPDERGATHELVVKPYERQGRGPSHGGGEPGANGGEDSGDYSAAWEEQGASPLRPRRAA